MWSVPSAVRRLLPLLRSSPCHLSRGFRDCPVVPYPVGAETVRLLSCRALASNKPWSRLSRISYHRDPCCLPHSSPPHCAVLSQPCRPISPVCDPRLCRRRPPRPLVYFGLAAGLSVLCAALRERPRTAMGRRRCRSGRHTVSAGRPGRTRGVEGCRKRSSVESSGRRAGRRHGVQSRRCRHDARRTGAGECPECRGSGECRRCRVIGRRP